ncbi:MAG: MBOAT family protein, partial [Bacteroidia bacterium]|nr:MBOAT family protein [Bacteroidia bacterium]
SGFWHGANWTFIIWGALNALYFLPLMLTKRNRKNINIVAQGKLLPSIREVSLMLLTFGLTVFAWIFFRAENIGHAFQYISGIFNNAESYIMLGVYWQYKRMIFLIVLFLIVEWIGREHEYALEKIGLTWNKIPRYSMYYVIIAAIIWFGGKEQEFIYFQF